MIRSRFLQFFPYTILSKKSPHPNIKKWWIFIEETGITRSTTKQKSIAPPNVLNNNRYKSWASYNLHNHRIRVGTGECQTESCRREKCPGEDDASKYILRFDLSQSVATIHDFLRRSGKIIGIWLATSLQNHFDAPFWPRCTRSRARSPWTGRRVVVPSVYFCV